ncbi:hypothetical protein L208DRAFT_1404545 [Tricholoma matsutake]|nr:hypothetical protein L208DRAFT_1404545 [Tricholoma matsutake 945]
MPIHTSKLSGEEWLEELMEGHPIRFRRQFGMECFVFAIFCGSSSGVVDFVLPDTYQHGNNLQYSFGLHVQVKGILRCRNDFSEVVTQFQKHFIGFSICLSQRSFMKST